MAEATPALEIRNLHKRYGEQEILKGISLTASTACCMMFTTSRHR